MISGRSDRPFGSVLNEVNQDTIHILFCADRHFIQHAAVAAVSMIQNSRSDRFCIHFVYCDRDSESEAKFISTFKLYRNVSIKFYYVERERIPTGFADRHVTKEAYLRFIAPEVLPPDISRVVYLDCDIVVVDDIVELASFDLGGRAVGAAPDCDWTQGKPDDRLLALGLNPTHSYVLSGVLVFDVKLWRDRGFTRQILASVEKLGPKLRYHDQDAFNIALQNEIQLFEKRWNLQALAFGTWLRRALPSEYSATIEARRRPGIIHFSTADKPWRFRSRARKRALYFKYLAMTTWRGARPAGLTVMQRIEYDFARIMIRLGVDIYSPLELGRRAGKWLIAAPARIGSSGRRLAR